MHDTYDNMKEKYKKLCEGDNFSIGLKDLRKMCYLTETDEDINVFTKMIRRYGNKPTSEKKVTFDTFNIGHEIIRLYYYLDKPLPALEGIYDTQMSWIFKNALCYQITLNLLFKHEMYDEVCSLFHLLQEQQFKKQRYDFKSFILYQAAAYKIKTEKSYTEMKQQVQLYTNWNGRYKTIEIIYALLYALAQNDASYALNYIRGTDTVSLNIKLAALVNIGNIAEALGMISNNKRESWCKCTLELLEKKFENSTDVDESLLTSYETFKKEMPTYNLLDKTLDDLAFETVNSHVKQYLNRWRTER